MRGEQHVRVAHPGAVSQATSDVIAGWASMRRMPVTACGSRARYAVAGGVCWYPGVRKVLG